MSIKIEYERDNLLSEYAIRILKDRYLIENEKSPQDAFARAANAFADDAGHAERLYNYASNLWFMFSTPVLANGGTSRGLPISCFLSEVSDTREGILGHYTENGWLASNGGGIGTYWGNLRTAKTKTSSGGESTGMVPFLGVVDREVLAFRQAGTRRAAYAAYLDISHPEIVEFLNIRKTTGGDSTRKCLNIHNAVNLTDAFMERLFAEDDTWELKDPHSSEVKEKVSARQLWQQILTLRTETGEPYLHFISTTNNLLPKAQQALGLRVRTSNLCSEITLATNEERTAVCCLSSLNLEKWDEWRDTDIVRDVIRMLDNVLTSFIDSASARKDNAFDKAAFSAMRERSLGLGAMGFHAYLQSKMIPFESKEASNINEKMFKHIRQEAEEASFQLALEKGVAPDYAESMEWKTNKLVMGRPTDEVAIKHAKKHGWKRNMHLLAIAPNASSSILCGNTSPSIEPFSACSFSQKTENGTHIFRNKYLQKILQDKKLDDEEIKSVWRSIAAKKGSVQHLTILTDEEKAVFKTAFEIDQQWIINHAAQRQKYIDQAQSVNLFFKTPIDVKYLHDTHYNAWKQGLKTLYYCRTAVSSKTEDVGQKVERIHLVEQPQKKVKTEVAPGYEIACVNCEG